MMMMMSSHAGGEALRWIHQRERCHTLFRRLQLDPSPQITHPARAHPTEALTFTDRQSFSLAKLSAFQVLATSMRRTASSQDRLVERVDTCLERKWPGNSWTAMLMDLFFLLLTILVHIDPTKYGAWSLYGAQVTHTQEDVACLPSCANTCFMQAVATHTALTQVLWPKLIVADGASVPALIPHLELLCVRLMSGTSLMVVLEVRDHHLVHLHKKWPPLSGYSKSAPSIQRHFRVNDVSRSPPTISDSANRHLHCTAHHNSFIKCGYPFI